MRAGALRHSIIIQQPSVTKDEFGAEVKTWVTFATARAAIEQMKSFDKAAAAASWPGADSFITIRYIPGVTADMRVLHGTKIYSILGEPNNVDGRNREIILTCQSGVKDI